MIAGTLAKKLLVREAKISILGQGYVGLPLALSFVRAGFSVTGIDLSTEKVRALLSGESYLVDVPSSDLRAAIKTGRYTATTSFDYVAQSDVVIICVPTPLSKSKDPDVSYIVSAVDEIMHRLHAGMLIILESTTYPGTTDELIASKVQAAGYDLGTEAFVCFSPERVDPGNKTFSTTNTPKVIGGVTPACTKVGELLYSQCLDRVVTVSSARIAEMVKLLENTFRSVNIGLVNEMALMCERMDIDVWEVIDAAATKPFGFMPFYPGPGIGGHCIPLDPMYLSWKAKSYGFYSQFIELASDINANMARHVVRKVSEALNLNGQSINKSHILLLGMSYKKDVNDVRESPALDVHRLLAEQGAIVEYHDPFVPSFREHEIQMHSVSLSEEKLESSDCVVLATNHSEFDYRWIASHARLIVDTRNAFKGINLPHVLRLGTATPTLERWRLSVSTQKSG